MSQMNLKSIKLFLLILSLVFFTAACGSNPYISNDANHSNDEIIARNQNIGNTIGNLLNDGRMEQDGNDIYFSTYEYEDHYARLYRTDLNGKNKVMLLEYLTSAFEMVASYGIYAPDDEIGGINVLDNWIYYIGAEKNVYKVDTNGENNRKLTDIKAGRLFAYEGKLYIIGDPDSQNGKLYLMDFNGENLSLLHDGFVQELNFYSDYIYFEQDSYLYRMDFNGDNIQKIFEHYYGVNGFHIYNDEIYYVLGHKLYKTDMAGENLTKICELKIQAGTGGMKNFFEKNFFYIGEEYDFFRNIKKVFYQVDLDTGTVNSRRIEDNLGYFYVINNKIFFDGFGGIYSMNFDGSGLKDFR